MIKENPLGWNPLHRAFPLPNFFFATSFCLFSRCSAWKKNVKIEKKKKRIKITKRWVGRRRRNSYASVAANRCRSIDCVFCLSFSSSLCVYVRNVAQESGTRFVMKYFIISFCGIMRSIVWANHSAIELNPLGECIQIVFSLLGLCHSPDEKEGMNGWMKGHT